MLVLLVACEPAQDSGKVAEKGVVECHSLRTEDALPSATQTFSIAHSAVSQRVVATNLGLPYLSVIDPDSETRTDAIRWTTAPANNPRVVVDGTGLVWIGSLSEPTLVQVDLSSGTVTEIDGIGGVNWLVALDDSVLVPLGGEAVRVGADGAVVATESSGPASGGARVGDDVVTLAGQQALRLDATTLSLRETCMLPFAADFVAGLPDGALVASDGQRVARVRCGDERGGESWTIGNDITSLVADGTSVWVLDRVGPQDPTHGTAWRVDVTGEPIAAFSTAKNTGYGEVIDGALWANAEGSSEVSAWSVSDGTPLAEVSIGTSTADVVVDDDGGVIATGRLSALVGRLDDGELTRTEPLAWPWAPVLAGERLVLLDHLEGKLASIDAHHLDDLVTVDLGKGPNSLLTFDSVAWWSSHGTWLVAESEADVLLEVDLEGGAVLNEWPLGGPALTDAHLASQLELQLDGDTALLARTADGRLTRLNLTSGDRVDGWLSDEHLDLLRSSRQSRATQLADGSLWVGPLRVNATTLAVEEVWAEVGSLLAPWPGEPGAWLAISPKGTALLHVDNAGSAGAPFEWFDDAQPGTVAALTPEADAVWVTRSYEGRVCRVPLALIDRGSTSAPGYPD